MPFSLYAAIVPSTVQIATAVAALVDKAEAYCSENGLEAAEILDARLASDMAPFTYQVKSVAVHSIGAIEGVRRGSFSPDLTPPPADFAGLRARLADTIAALKELDPAEIDGFEGRDMEFAFGERRMPFRAEDFLLSFSQPNFYFHATTTYDLLRWKGIPLGKPDFIGRPRLEAMSGVSTILCGAAKAARMATRSRSRSAARLAAVQALYQLEMEQTPLRTLLTEFHHHRLGATIEEVEYADAEIDFFDDVVAGVDARRDEIDGLITGKLAAGWSLERLDKPMRQILRAGTYELLARADVPTGSVITEYVDVAHAFYDKRETGFVNGLLDAIAKVVRT